jgi:hypothetical protein
MSTGIGNFFKESIGDAEKSSWNPVIFFGILLIATMPFVQQQKLIFIGYILVAILYLVIFMNVIYGAFKMGVYEGVKGVLSNPGANTLFKTSAFSPSVTSFGFVKYAFMLFFIIINTMSWISSAKKGAIWGAVLMPLAPVILYFGLNQFTGGTLDTIGAFQSILFFLTVAAFIGIIVFNFYSITDVLATLSNRAKKLKSYDLRLSKKRMNELNGYSISLYLAILSSMYIINDATSPITTSPITTSPITTSPPKLYPNSSSFIPVSIAYLLFTGASIGNYFNLRKIVPGLNYDSTKIIKKTPAENEKETTEQKVQNQNFVLTAYYGILNFFNPANL